MTWLDTTFYWGTVSVVTPNAVPFIAMRTDLPVAAGLALAHAGPDVHPAEMPVPAPVVLFMAHLLAGCAEPTCAQTAVLTVVGTAALFGASEALRYCTNFVAEPGKVAVASWSPATLVCPDLMDTFLGGTGLSLKLIRAEIAQARVPAPTIVEQLDVLDNRGFRFRAGPKPPPVD